MPIRTGPDPDVARNAVSSPRYCWVIAKPWSARRDATRRAERCSCQAVSGSACSASDSSISAGAAVWSACWASRLMPVLLPPVLSLIAGDSIGRGETRIERAGHVVVGLWLPQAPEAIQIGERILAPVHAQVGDWPRDLVDDEQASGMDRARLAARRSPRMQRSK